MKPGSKLSIIILVHPWREKPQFGPTPRHFSSQTPCPSLLRRIILRFLCSCSAPLACLLNCPPASSWIFWIYIPLPSGSFLTESHTDTGNPCLHLFVSQVLYLFHWFWPLRFPQVFILARAYRILNLLSKYKLTQLGQSCLCRAHISNCTMWRRKKFSSTLLGFFSYSNIQINMKEIIKWK